MARVTTPGVRGTHAEATAARALRTDPRTHRPHNRSLQAEGLADRNLDPLVIAQVLNTATEALRYNTFAFGEPGLDEESIVRVVQTLWERVLRPVTA